MMMFQEQHVMLTDIARTGTSSQNLDDATVSRVGIDELYSSVNLTRTLIGAYTLFSALRSPLTSLSHISDKQNAILELQTNPELYERVAAYLNIVRDAEPHMYKLMTGQIQPDKKYKDFLNSQSAVSTLFSALNPLLVMRDRAHSSLLDEIFSIIKAGESSRGKTLLDGPVYKTRFLLGKTLYTKEQLPAFHFKEKFVPIYDLLRYSALTTGAGGLLVGAPIIQNNVYGAIAGLFIWSTFIAYGVVYKNEKHKNDVHYYINPIARELKSDKDFIRSLQAVGQLDMLMSAVEWTKLHQRNGGAVVLPEITDYPKHFFVAKGLINTALVHNNQSVVPIDISLEDERLTVITGMNSGGKTTAARSVMQAQILAQSGLPILAHAASINIADLIKYQAPFFDGQLDYEGRLGTELKETAKTLKAVSQFPKSLVILDEVAQGTSREESIALTGNILKTLRIMGATTICVTHDYMLAQELQAQGIGQHLTIEVGGESSTRRLIPGISTQSFAHVVAGRYGLSHDQLNRLLKQHGLQGID